MESIKALILELDQLKSVYRKSYIANNTRNENSAEHSWQLAVVIYGFKHLLPKEVNLDHCIKIALLHDICEIGAGDVCTYHSGAEQSQKESQYMDQFVDQFPNLGFNAKAYWQEYEDQQTTESKWVKIFDRLLPLTLNLATDCKTWQEMNVTASMVLGHHAFIDNNSPEIYQWITKQVNQAVSKGLIEA